ncbi:hypothetical protein MPER_12597 [Moniliophthora perniciosa FA553]|nr:hypothetical protein MPER_12597 [Moniliophthora perniciosa FA553]
MVEKINVTEFENSQNSIPVPPAVFQHIFHEFKDEKSFLGRCSLVCRAWAYHIRQRLFHESVQEERLRRFIELCSNNHSTIPAAGIRVFTLCGKYEALRLAHAWLSTPISGDTNSNGHAIMADRILCDLKHLKLPDLYWVPLDTLHAICHLQAFSKIRQ